MRFPTESANPLDAEPEFHRTITLKTFFDKEQKIENLAGLAAEVRKLVKELKAE